MTLLAVSALSGPASAQPLPLSVAPPTPAQPRVLPSGAPACGNVMDKYSTAVEDPLCPVFRNLRDLEALGWVFEARLTIEAAFRPLVQKGSFEPERTE